MKRITLILTLMLSFTLTGLAATGVKGTLVDAKTGKGVAGANLLLRDQAIFVMSGSDGSFSISNAQPGTDVLEIIADGYEDRYVDVKITNDLMSNLGEIKLTESGFYAGTLNNDDYIFDEAQIQEEEGAQQTIGTIQGATDDVYYQTANYNFSAVRFRLRGYDSNLTAGYINGFNYNDGMRGRFNFSGLGGMTSSAFRNKSVDVGLAAASYGFGDIGGSSNFTTYASEYAPGFRGNLSYTNSNYMLRAMLQYSTGLTKSGWAFSGTIIGRYAPEGVIEGTFYNSVGYSLSLQKVFNDKHSLNLTTWGAPTQRATNTATTQEAYDLAGSNLYNPSWGYLNGKKKSSKVINSFDPSVLLNWIWKPKMGTIVNTGVGFRHSAYSSSSLNWFQTADPRPDYYRYMPSYYDPNNPAATNYYIDPADRFNYDGSMTTQYALYMQNYEQYKEQWETNKAYRQIDWNSLYQTNLLNREIYERNPEYTGQSSYILEDRHSNFTSWMFNSYIDHRLNDFMTLQGGLSFNYTDGHYFKTIRNLLGGEFWRDVDTFAERDFPGNPSILQNNLDDPNRRVVEGDVFGYDYHILTYLATAWIQNQIRTVHWDVNYGIELNYNTFFRHGNMRNGRAPENSLGAGKRHTFDTGAIKAGATYKINGRNYFVAHASYGTRAPLPDNAYVSPRIKDEAITGLSADRFLSGDISYVWNYSRFRGSITGFYTHVWDATKRWAGFYDDNLNTFMNYSTSGLETEYKGIELGMSYKIYTGLTLTAAGTFGQYQYKNNPFGVRSYENGAQADVSNIVYLKNYHIGGTPQQAYSIGLDYAAPQNWFFGVNGNLFCDNYIDLAPSRHEAMPLLYSVCNTEAEMLEKQAALTHQDKLKNAFVLNLSIGKMIYTKFGALNFNLNINNVLNNRNIQTGGYQQGRVDYVNYNVDRFPNKIYYAQGIRIFFNFGIRF